MCNMKYMYVYAYTFTLVYAIIYMLVYIKMNNIDRLIYIKMNNNIDIYKSNVISTMMIKYFALLY